MWVERANLGLLEAVFGLFLKLLVSSKLSSEQRPEKLTSINFFSFKSFKTKKFSFKWFKTKNLSELKIYQN